MTSKERMLTAMRNKQPDMVPVAPDMSNMIPAKLTGKPFWDIYLYRNPPLWKAYIDTVRHFGIDGWLASIDGQIFDDYPQPGYKTENVIVFRNEERIITRVYSEKEKGKKEWSDFITVYYVKDPPTYLKASKIGMQAPPEKWWQIEGVKPEKKDEALLAEVKEYMGDDGVSAVGCCPPQLSNPEGGGYSVFDYYDRYKEVKEWSERATEDILKRLRKVLSSPSRPDFILTGGSGMLVFMTPKIVRDISFPALKKITTMCKDAGVPTQIHCCGPERALVEMCANETDLTSINPLEIPPMGDCDLAEIKRSFGKNLSLMGNLHTTEVMLRGKVADVKNASKKAIDDAAAGGGFLLSTGDQCGRDTPEENIFAMVETARSYGKY
ncbi:hypothetical protein COY52_03760 [Candidatus Desantisbacteria bacterium CG_4_10_14_0_8_um_filter_48_22]|uniref:Uroporphyrinogen decarboxylase (URO-D) domain-containing protein n=1 Tax=Candidatus Desantisbacteria bacterium CG_4_10_14_0_8_um_filter_48_22 TaxID=1974543 RepID=A0A2M7SDQ7_9BACT|nr:MAG: hypothetical protein AUJ67_05630 [Candidatus Desantisbacteria bacterium CG1_02_49_89]PIV57411.1 MAG: hypothetical protein COS16_00465 [Candidatus Desantisbacteria bacterium CG02_land_8_20_14_3_00_49_13]PIZ17600.1 MAG: hypothetical protein COY52_03760 [Candidatus Desantisbacteria bacterium CG_4_10_14_0_8_um_filter_48_22]